MMGKCLSHRWCTIYILDGLDLEGYRQDTLLLHEHDWRDVVPFVPTFMLCNIYII
jgi:hypothetical protein